MFWQRNKAAELSSPRENVSPRTSIGEGQQGQTEASRDRQSPTRMDTEHPQVSMPPSATAYLNKLKGPESPSLGRTHSRSRTRSLTQSMIARMQPTVADVSEDDATKYAVQARSSATSLDLINAHSSDASEQPLAKASTTSTTSQTFDTVGEPLKPFQSVPNMSSGTKPSAPQRPVDSQIQSPAMQHYVYPTPPGSYPSPPQKPLEPVTQISHKPLGLESPQQRPLDTPKPAPRPTAATPTISPPHSPRSFQPPPMYSAPPVPFSYGYPPQVGHEQLGPTAYYSTMEQHYMPSPPLTAPDVARSFPGEKKDDHQRDWHKVTSVLPELNRLLAHFEDQKGDSSKDSFAKQMDYQRTQEMAKMRVELDANKEEYEKVIQQLVSESYKYKSEIRERDEKIARMQSTIDEFVTIRAKHGDSTTQYDSLRKEHEALLIQHDQITAESQSLKKTYDSLQKKADGNLADARHYKNECISWKEKYQEAAAASDQARLAKENLVSVKMKLEEHVEDLRRKLQGKEEKHQAELKNARRDFEAAIESEKKEKIDAATEYKALNAGLQLELTGLIDRHNRSKKELEIVRSASQSLEKKLEGSRKDLEAQTAWHRQQMENKSREMDTHVAQLLQQVEAKKKDMDEQTASHRYQLESQLTSLTSQRHRELDTLRDEQAQALRRLYNDLEAGTRKLDEQHETEVQKIQGELNEQRAAFDRYKKETERLRTGHGELAATIISWKQRQAEWQAEQDKLSKVLEALGLSESSRMTSARGA